jgi:opacity protein-like surface antigen
MRGFRRYVGCMLLILCLAGPAQAQRGGRVSLVALGGVLYPIMHHPSTDRFETRPALTGGAMINYGINDYLGVDFGLLLSEQRVITGDNDDDKNTMTTQELLLQLRWNVLTGPWRPFLQAGVNYNVISLDPPLNDESDAGITMGAGVELIFTDHISFGLVGRYSNIFVEHFDSAEMVSGLATAAFSF